MKNEWEPVTAANEEQVIGLFAQFTRLRQAGQNREAAWLNIERELDRLSAPDYQRLLSLVRGWEAKEGRYYRPNTDDRFKTANFAPDRLTEVRQTMNSSNKRIIRRIKPVTPPAVASAELDAEVECPVCRTSNQRGRLNCTKCGALLLKGTPSADGSETRPLADGKIHDSSFFGDGMVLYLRVRDAQEMLRVRPGAGEMIVGRRSPDSVMLPDVDLSGYQADLKGVSRLHASLRRHGNTLVLTDMGSLNHTHVNGQRLHAHEVRVLHDGDEIRFGQLTVNVYFRGE